MKVKSFVKGAVSALLAAGVALSCASVANAASRTYYPISSGAIENGYYRGSYTASANRSYITLSSYSHTTVCYAKQDGHSREASSTGSPGMGCSAVQTGTNLTVGDRVRYVVS